jgi:hypothetical protein
MLKLTLYGPFERYLNMTFGLFVIGNNIALLSGLLYSDIVRSAYGQQKGGELMGDFDQIAMGLDMTVQSVAKLSLGYMIFMIVSGIIVVMWWRKNEETSE